MKSSTKSKHAEHGEKMIEIQLRFFTDQIAKGKSNILPKHCWSMGVVKIQANGAHGIKAMKNPKVFNSLLDLSAIIEKVLLENGITMHMSSRMRKYFEQ